MAGVNSVARLIYESQRDQPEVFNHSQSKCQSTKHVCFSSSVRERHHPTLTAAESEASTPSILNSDTDAALFINCKRLTQRFWQSSSFFACPIILQSLSVNEWMFQLYPHLESLFKHTHHWVWVWETNRTQCFSITAEVQLWQIYNRWVMSC